MLVCFLENPILGPKLYIFYSNFGSSCFEVVDPSCAPADLLKNCQPHSVHPSPLSAGGGIEPSAQFSKRGGLDRMVIFSWGFLGKRGVTSDFLGGGGGGGGVQFLHKK